MGVIRGPTVTLLTKRSEFGKMLKMGLCTLLEPTRTRRVAHFLREFFYPVSNTRASGYCRISERKWFKTRSPVYTQRRVETRDLCDVFSLNVHINGPSQKLETTGKYMNE